MFDISHVSMGYIILILLCLLNHSKTLRTKWLPQLFMRFYQSLIQEKSFNYFFLPPNNETFNLILN